jgi:hypothetical protein
MVVFGAVQPFAGDLSMRESRLSRQRTTTSRTVETGRPPVWPAGSVPPSQLHNLPHSTINPSRP